MSPLVTTGAEWAHMAPVATGPWEDEDLSSATRMVIGGLTPGETLWARTCANGSGGASEWSTPTAAMAI